jgi:hypothetical protein
VVICYLGFFLCAPKQKDGDVIVAAGIRSKGVVDMGNDLYINICFIFVWCVKYIFIPLGVAILGRILSEKLLRPRPKKQRKKRLIKTV